MDSTRATSRTIGNRSAWHPTVEYGAAVVLCLLLSVLVINQKIGTSYEFQGDTGLFYQTLQSIRTYGLPYSSIGEGSIWLHHYHVYRLTAAQLARDPLSPSPVPTVNMLGWHSYFILYPIALLTFAFRPPAVLLGTYVLSFTGVLLFAYLLIRRNGVPLLPTLLYCLLVVTYAGWSQGIAGQFYPDRVFVLAGLGFMYAISRKQSPILIQIALGLVCASITERGALVAGIAAIAYPLFSWRDSGQRYFRLGLGVALLALSLAEFHSLVNTVNGHYLPTSIAQLVKWLTDARFAHETLLFLLVNLPLLVLALFDWRRAAVAVLLMLPNVFGSINGQEKVGWTTSYHSYYMPALILASASGFCIAYAKTFNTRKRIALLAGTCALILFSAMLNPYSYQQIDVRSANIASSFVPKLARAATDFDRYNSETATDEAIRKAVPQGSLVSAVEPAMPILYRNRTIQFYPLGIDQAGYAVLSIRSEPDGRPYLFAGFNTFRGAAEQARIDAVLLARLRRDGYDVEHPLVFESRGLVVLKHSKTMLREL